MSEKNNLAGCGNHDPERNCRFAEIAADRAVRKVFAILGVDVDKPESVEDFREDLRFGKKMRKVADASVMKMAVLIVCGFAFLFVVGLKTQFGGTP